MTHDYAELALRSRRADFVRLHADCFLVGSANLRRPSRPSPTGMHAIIDAATLDGDGDKDASVDDDTPLVLPVRKVQPNFPSMITVGRTENNDIPLADVTVSRFHAFFRRDPEHDNRLELGDAGSRNGTWLAGRRLVPKGPVQAVSLGEVVRFGSLAFIVLDAGGCWDELHKLD